MVTERLMLPGDWSLTLIPETPKTVRDVLDFFGHIYILDDQVDSRKFSDAQMKAKARWAGILRHRPTAFSLQGPGLLAWLGDESGKGDVFEAVFTRTAASFSTWVTDLLASPRSIRLGTLTAIAGTETNSFQYQTPRVALDWVMLRFGGEYRVKPDFTCDAGPSSSIFNTTPTVIATATEQLTTARAANGGRDISIVGLPTTNLDLDYDADDYSTRILQGSVAGANTAQANAPATPYKDGYGNPVLITRVISDSNTPAAAAAAVAAANATTWSKLHQQVMLSTDEFDIGRDVKVGDWLYVYDPLRGLVDKANQVRYRGSTLFPLKIRTVGMTWPIERGLGVYYRDLNGVYTDLTNFVAWEPPGATFDVGATWRKWP